MKEKNELKSELKERIEKILKEFILEEGENGFLNGFKISTYFFIKNCELEFSEIVPVAGITKKEGEEAKPVLFLNPTNIITLKDSEIKFILFHEMLHVLWEHFERGENIISVNKISFEDVNICGDSLINYFLKRISENLKLEIPFRDQIVILYEKMFENFKGPEILEFVVDFYLNFYLKNKNNNDSNSYNNSNNKGNNSSNDNSSSCNNSNNKGNNSSNDNGNKITSFEGNLKSNLSKEDIEKIKKNIIDKAIEIGKYDENVKDFMNKIEELASPSPGDKSLEEKIEVLINGEEKFDLGNLEKEIKKEISKKAKKESEKGKLKGFRSFNKFRRGMNNSSIRLPGKIKRKINKELIIDVIIDTSGSVDEKKLNKFFKFLNYTISKNLNKTIDVASLKIIQIDTEIKDEKTIKISKGLFKKIDKIEVVGRGGTWLQPAINKVSEEKNLDLLLVFTDGEVEKDDLNFKNINSKVFIILNNDENFKINYENNEKGVEVIRI